MSIILRSYREVWRDVLRAEAGPEQVTRLPLRRIGARDGIYVISGARHEAAARYIAEQLAAGPGLAAEIALAGQVEGHVRRRRGRGVPRQEGGISISADFRVF